MNTHCILKMFPEALYIFIPFPRRNAQLVIFDGKFSLIVLILEVNLSSLHRYTNRVIYVKSIPN